MIYSWTRQTISIQSCIRWQCKFKEANRRTNWRMDIKAHKPLYDLIRQAHFKKQSEKSLKLKNRQAIQVNHWAPKFKSDFGFDFLLFLYCWLFFKIFFVCFVLRTARLFTLGIYLLVTDKISSSCGDNKEMVQTNLPTASSNYFYG